MHSHKNWSFCQRRIPPILYSLRQNTSTPFRNTKSWMRVERHYSRHWKLSKEPIHSFTSIPCKKPFFPVPTVQSHINTISANAELTKSPCWVQVLSRIKHQVMIGKSDASIPFVLETRMTYDSSILTHLHDASDIRRSKKASITSTFAKCQSWARHHWNWSWWAVDSRCQKSLTPETTATWNRSY